MRMVCVKQQDLDYFNGDNLFKRCLDGAVGEVCVCRAVY